MSLSGFNAGSDHSLVRATFRFNLKSERNKIITSTGRYEKQELASLQDTFQIELQNKFEVLEEESLDVDHMNHLLC